MTLDESVHGMRLRVIERAQVQGNVSAVCRELGISRTVFYRRRQRLERYGVDGVHPRRQRAHAGRPVATAPVVFCRSHDIGRGCAMRRWHSNDVLLAGLLSLLILLLLVYALHALRQSGW